MSAKKENLEPGKGCLSCAHNKDISTFLDMYRLATDQNDERQEEGIEFMENLRDNPAKRTVCRFYDGEDGILKSYLVERDSVRDAKSCNKYVEVKYVATKERKKKNKEEEDEDFEEENLEEITEDNEDDLDLDDNDYDVDDE